MTYTTVSGDMWDVIALKTLGDEMHMNRIMSANAQYRNIVLFPAGIVLTIPDVPETVSDTLPVWKRRGV